MKFRGIGESSCGLIDYSEDGNLSLNTKHNTFKILKLQSAMTKNGIDRLKRLQEEISSTHDSTKNERKQLFTLGKEKIDKLEAQLQNDIASRLPYIDYCDYSNYNDCVDGNWGEDDWNDNWNDKNE